jgi:hypothetical protein
MSSTRKTPEHLGSANKLHGAAGAAEAAEAAEAAAEDADAEAAAVEAAEAAEVAGVADARVSAKMALSQPGECVPCSGDPDWSR